LFLLLPLFRKYLLIGKDNRYSNSQFQVTIWFGILVISYIVTVLVRSLMDGGNFIGGVSIPQNLLILSGISAFTFGAAKVITSGKVRDAQEKAENAARQAGGAAAINVAAVWAQAEQEVKPTANAPSFPSDLLRDDHGRPDLGDIQTVIIVLLAVGVYIMEVFHFLGTIELRRVVTLPDVDTTILAIFGLGKGTYLIKKYAKD
jgi:hypothetical protein